VFTLRAGLDASGNTWETLENLTYREEAIRDFERARGVPRSSPVFLPPPSHVCGSCAPALPPPLTGGRRVAAGSSVPLRGLCRSGEFFFYHVLAHPRRRTSAVCGAVESLLDAALYRTRWVLLSRSGGPPLSLFFRNREVEMNFGNPCSAWCPQTGRAVSARKSE
jgi:hypothetical protein